jgi:hypothetical protein
MLDAITALRALRVLRCPYAPDLAAIDGAWRATCPNCHRPEALRIRELRERDDEHRNPQVSVGCVHRCTEPAEIAELLSTDPELLTARAETARWQSRYRWALGLARRQLNLEPLERG